MLIGRKEEIRSLRKAYDSDQSEFVAVYGRRRVGKTYLVRETFGNEFTFYHTGLSNSPLRKQLANWQSSLHEYGGSRVRCPRTWLEAFDMLKELIKQSTDTTKVIFIDELPWMDTPRSGFVTALEHFWNGWASARKDILLITCGSATSWMMNTLIRNKGGLHNRVTLRLPLFPFSLHECEDYAKNRRLGFTRRQVLECYMMMGGVPYYWSFLDKSLSLAQNIDKLYFSPSGQLHDEFDELFASLFKQPRRYISVIRVLATKRIGLTRDEIISMTKDTSDNGKLTEVLSDLESCGFVRRYANFGYKAKNAIYQLTDPYTLFYYRFIDGNIHNDPHFWSSSQATPLYYNWVGLAFERVCLDHVRQIKRALGVEGVLSNEYGWISQHKSADDSHGTQIDLLIDRNDDVIDLCEMKCTQTAYSMSESEHHKMLNRRARFIAETKTTKAVHLILVSAAAVKHNAWTNDMRNIITLDSLFEP